MQVSYNNKSSGFTVVEMIVVTVVLAILSGLVITVLGVFYSDNTTSLSKAIQDTDATTALRGIEKELSNSTGFRTAVTAPVTPTGSDNAAADWSYLGTSANSRVLLARSYATNENPADDTNNDRKPVFQCACGSCDYSTAAVAESTLVYFVATDPSITATDPNTSKLSLFRRTFTPSGALCGTPWQKQSCSVDKVALYSSVCKASDAVLLKNVTSFSIDYYIDQNNKYDDAYNTSVAAATREPYITNARSIGITVKTGKWAYNSIYEATSTIRISTSN